MFERKMNVEDPDGQIVEIDIYHDAELVTRGSFFLVACGWLDHFKNTPPYKNSTYTTKFDGDLDNDKSFDIEFRKAHFPWVMQLRENYWVYSGTNGYENGNPKVVIHDGMTLQAELGTLVHELMHLLYNVNVTNPETEFFVQEKSIENVVKMMRNYKGITHPNNEGIFNRHGSTREALSLQQLISARNYLQYGMDLHFYGAYQRSL